MHGGTNGPSVGEERPYERVFLLELSGPTISFLRERADRLRRMLEQGAWGELEGPLQPVAPLSYGTLLSGQNPGKTGLYDFFRFPAGAWAGGPPPGCRDGHLPSQRGDSGSIVATTSSSRARIVATSG
jgi:hypothetical protein